MNVKFKVWDWERKEWNNENIFFIGKCGNLFTVRIGQIKIANPKFIPVFSTGKTDKNGVELFEGDTYEVTDGDEWVVGELVFDCSDSANWDKRVIGKKIGSKYENPELVGPE